MAADFLPPGQPSTGPSSPPLQPAGHSSRASMDLGAVTATAPLSGGRGLGAGAPGRAFLFGRVDCSRHRASTVESGVLQAEGTAYAKAQEVGVLAAVRGPVSRTSQSPEGGGMSCSGRWCSGPGGSFEYPAEGLSFTQHGTREHARQGGA